MSIPKPILFAVILAIATIALVSIVLISKGSSGAKLPKSVTTETKTLKQTDNQIKLQTDEEYPFVKTVGSNAGEQINTNIQSLISSQSASFKKDLSGINVSNLPPEMQKLNNEFNTRYKVYRADPEIFSTNLEISTMFVGAAHPNTTNFSYNYSFKDSKALSLGDLFKNPDYLQTLSTISRQKLQSQLNKDSQNFDDFINPGTEAKAENFSNFVLTDNALILIFNPYQVTPYAWGSPIVEIPYSQLGSNFNSNLAN